MITALIRFILSLFFLIPLVVTGNNIHFRKLTVAEGLSNNFVRAIHKDAQGFMWFGTLEGLDRYDGVEIRSFAHKFPTANVRVNCITHDSRNLWVGTDAGLLYWDFISENFERVDIPMQQPMISVLLPLPGDSLILAGTSDGIFLINSTTFISRRIPITGSDEPLRITGAEIEHDRVWISASGALIELDIRDFTTHTYLNNDPSAVFNNFSSITIIGENVLVGTHTRGLFVFDTQLKRFTPFTNVGSNFILSLAYRADGTLFIGTDGKGLLIMDTNSGKIRVYTQDLSIPGSLNSNAVYSIFLEDSGRYWIGTYTGGVNYRSRKNDHFMVLLYENGVFIGENNIRSLYFDDSGTRYLGTDGNGLMVLEPKGGNHVFNTQQTSQVRSNVVLALHKFQNFILVGGFRGGISMYNPKTQHFKVFREEGIFQHGSIYGFDYDSHGNLWISGLEGLSRINENNGAFKHFTSNNSQLKNDLLIALLYDSQGRLWTGSVSGGVAVYFPGDEDVKPVITGVDLSAYKAVSFFEDKSGNIWIPTEGSGLIEVSSDLQQINVFNTSNGLPSNMITAITEAPENVFWISTHKGLSRYERSSGAFVRYTLSDGLPSLVFNRNAVINEYEKTGKIWFGSEKGLVCFYPDSIARMKYSEPVVITDLFISGQSMYPPISSMHQKPYDIKRGQKSIGFRFVALNYYNPADNTYAYRLLGKSDEWTLSSDNLITFPDLHPGRYTFEVYLPAGPEDLPQITSVDINVRPFFYQKPVFIALMTLAILSILLLLISFIRKLRYRLHLLQLEHKNESTIEKNKEGTRYESSHLSSERRKEIEVLLIKYIEENQSYLNAELKLSDLAQMIDCSPHDISQVINQNLGQSFYEFINGYRINSVKNCMHDPSYAKYTLVAIAQQCGFSSKTSFYRAFKKLTGQTPQEYQVFIKESSREKV